MKQAGKIFMAYSFIYLTKSFMERAILTEVVILILMFQILFWINDMFTSQVTETEVGYIPNFFPCFHSYA